MFDGRDDIKQHLAMSEGKNKIYRWSDDGGARYEYRCLKSSRILLLCVFSPTSRFTCLRFKNGFKNKKTKKLKVEVCPVCTSRWLALHVRCLNPRDWADGLQDLQWGDCTEQCVTKLCWADALCLSAFSPTSLHLLIRSAPAPCRPVAARASCYTLPSHHQHAQMLLTVICRRNLLNHLFLKRLWSFFSFSRFLVPP